MISSIGGASSPLVRFEGGWRNAARPNDGVSLFVASTQRSVAGQFQLVTRDGDRVTISAEASVSVTYARTSGPAPGGRFAARFLSAETSREVSMQVQGDLDAREMAGIERLVRSFFRELNAAFRGVPGIGAFAALRHDVTRGVFEPAPPEASPVDVPAEALPAA